MARTGAILLIDDDRDVRAANAIALEEAGYAVLQAPNWEQALPLAGTDLALVITDLIMPGGIEGFGRLRRQIGPIPVVVLSGYPSMMKLLDGVLDGVVAWLRKPAAEPALLDAVARALAGPSSP
ncbi:MAG TPA: response regulator [Candidatus Binatia bacterium]|nr:response regulator [Candidatus Binatia bacterium]